MVSEETASSVMDRAAMVATAAAMAVVTAVKEATTTALEAGVAGRLPPQLSRLSLR